MMWSRHHGIQICSLFDVQTWSSLLYQKSTMLNVVSSCVWVPAAKALLWRLVIHLLSKLDEFWLEFRISNIDVPASNLLVKGQPAKSFTSNLPKLSGALNEYCLLKGIGKSDQFFTVAKRNIGCVIDYVGDRPLDTYSTSDASSFRLELFRRKLSSTSVQRIFSTIRAAINITIQEDGLSCINAFAKTYLPNEERPKHPSLSNEDIQRVQKVCFDIADERR